MAQNGTLKVYDTIGNCQLRQLLTLLDQQFSPGYEDHQQKYNDRMPSLDIRQSSIVIPSLLPTAAV